MAEPVGTGPARGRLWGGRFAGGPTEVMAALSRSVDFDWRLARYDLAGSKAHARALHRAGLLEAGDLQAMLAGLDRLESAVAAGTFRPQAGDEDVHGALERGLIELLGPELGGRLRAGRSRNDQIATLIRMYLRDAIRAVALGVLDVVEALIAQAQDQFGAVMPGRTHLQHAQPVLVSHHLLAHAWPLLRDCARLGDLDARLDLSPYGSAALAGTPLGLDPEAVAVELGFAASVPNSIDGTSARDQVAEAAYVLAQIGIDLSRLSEDVIIWCTHEFGFVSLAEEWSTGSSIMPQKKNPDVLELIRGRSGRVIGSLTTLLVLVKGLPLAYNRDLQEDKEPLFDAFDTVGACLDLAAAVVNGARLRSDRIAARLEEGFLDATTLMEHLIGLGVPQRSAHEVVGRMVGLAEQRGCRLADLSAADFAEAHPALTPEVKDRLGIANVVAAFRSHGSTGPDLVAAQLARWRERLGPDPEG